MSLSEVPESPWRVKIPEHIVFPMTSISWLSRISLLVTIITSTNDLGEPEKWMTQTKKLLLTNLQSLFGGYYAMSGTNVKKNQKSNIRSIVDHYPLSYTAI
jgi:hypothetical protein